LTARGPRDGRRQIAGRYAAGCDAGMDKRAEFGLAHLRVLGQRLRTLRRTRNLSLRRLANESGVSVAAIQDLEAGNSSPSLLNVLSIAEVLGEPDNAVRLVQGRLPVTSGKRNSSLGLLSAPRMRGAILLIAAKSKLKEADRPTAVPMFAYVLDGTVDLTFGAGRKERLAASDAVHIAREPPAAWSNPFARRAIILCVAALAAAADVPGAFDG
jgi:transcriptional regulator with XRE-family HTH domain